MIDLMLIRRFLSTANLSVSDLEKHGRDVMTEVQTFFGPFRDEKIDSPEVTNFNSFAFAWNRLPRSDKFRFIALAYRQNKTMFASVKLDDSVKWDDFDLSQQSMLYNTTCDALRAAVTLFSDEAFVANYRSGFIGAMREINNQKAAELKAVV